MKIGIDVSQSVYVGTGVGSYTQNLVRALVTDFPEHEYVLFASTLRRQKQLQDFFHSLPQRKTITAKFYSFPPTVLSLMWNKLHAPQVENFIGKVDLFHTSDWTEPPARIPKVTTIHDLIVYKYPETLVDRITDTQKSKLAWVKKETSAVIVDSESTKIDVSYYLKIPDSKIHVVYLGVNDIFSPQEISKVRKVRKKYKLSGNYLLCVGTREPRKNLERLIRAYQELELDDLTLVIAGNPGWGDEVARYSKMRVLGYVSEEDLPALYAGASCFVYPTLYEGFGLPVLEAMACGAPVITSEKGSLKEITANQTIYVDPENVSSIVDGLKKILKLSPSERRQIAQKSRDHARKFTWKKTAEKTLQVYQSILKNRQLSSS